MTARLRSLFIFFTISTVICKEPELPLCPSNINYFPQNLPMHCRMPRSIRFSSSPMPPLPPFPQPFPIFPQPGMPLPAAAPPSPQMAAPAGAPVPMPAPAPMPPMPPMMPMPMPLPPSGPAHKLPVIVMPFYSPDPAYKKPEPPKRGKRRKVHIYQGRPSVSDADTSSDTDTDTDTDSGDSEESSNEARGWWKNKRGFRRSMRRRHKSKRRKHNHDKEHLLTPILQYVTKDGYVIYEKKITKNEAGNWLDMNGAEGNKNKPPVQQIPQQNNQVELIEPSNVGDAAEAEVESDISREEVTTMRVQRAKKHNTHKSKQTKARLKKAEEQRRHMKEEENENATY